MLVDIYCDEGKSAKNIKDFCEVWDLLKDHKASFVTLRENFDTTTASGEMMVFVQED